jgi:hypothetical protein
VLEVVFSLVCRCERSAASHDFLDRRASLAMTVLLTLSMTHGVPFKEVNPSPVLS